MREMKDSGIEWVGQIPESWNVLRNKFNFVLGKDLIGANWEKAQLLSLTKYGVKAITPEEQTGKVPTSFTTYQIVKKNDLVMCLFDLDVSAVFSGISQYDGMISPAYKCFKCKSNLNPRYADYYYRTVFVDRKFKRYSKNVRYSLGTDEFLALPMLVPSTNEQRRIADYLDTKCAEIDALRADIEKEIETLEAYKKSVITEAVTKGLNPNVEMKESGIEWVGKIPEKWKIIPLKYVITYNDEALPETTDTEFEFDYIDIGSVSYGRGIEQYQRMQFKDAPSRARRIVQCNDVILSTVRTYLKAVAAMPEHDIPIIVSTGFIAMRAGESIKPNYLKYVAQSNTFVSNIEAKSYGISYPAITPSEIANTHIALPPEKEQLIIAEYLDTRCAEIDSILANTEKQLAVLDAYKKTIIYEYVTGKNEVPVS
jgi:type I restriction enzyme S subunit